ncbi:MULTISPECIES: IS110 family transposase [unclassified Nostoc]|uniref:IS110 family transposase n=1 Tax=unclassified Nostoc TaxID=2593658 RepID=UPI002AD5A5BC|nr:IS110 family transposase [Nostoc sp. DedQUE03]MDZ7973448.1 IS110 family transposase [Nostoc sp. DedQUE03]MDZ8045064.1 IS110 family transposase [Nostoc sp. DedQUE02]
MIRILGLDVSKSSVSACLLTDKPSDPRQFYYECPFLKLSANAKGIQDLLALNADIALLEPTGNNYSKLWGTHLARAGVEVRLVGHKELRNYRANHLALPDKDDDADALALGCYYFDYHQDPRRFVQIRDREIVRIRELVLRLAHLNRVQSPIMNRARQDLAWQFPEVALVKSRRGELGEAPMLWGWLAGIRKSSRYDRLYSQSVGLGISDTVREHAKRICDLQREEHVIETELRQLLADSRFEHYRAVFKKFGFGDRLTAIVLSQIYPIEGFLLDGKPEVRIRQGRNSKKPTKRHLSLRRFQKALGAAPSMEASGDSRKSKVVGGSDLCRKSLWQWVFTRIEPKRSRLKNEIGKTLGEQLDTEKAAGRPVKLVRNRIAAKGARLLFRELVKGLT